MRAAAADPEEDPGPTSARTSAAVRPAVRTSDARGTTRPSSVRSARSSRLLGDVPSKLSMLTAATVPAGSVSAPSAGRADATSEAAATAAAAGIFQCMRASERPTADAPDHARTRHLGTHGRISARKPPNSGTDFTRSGDAKRAGSACSRGSGPSWCAQRLAIVKPISFSVVRPSMPTASIFSWYFPLG